jgi:hypothetical protein
LWSSRDANSITSISEDKDTQEEEPGAIIKAPDGISWKEAQGTSEGVRKAPGLPLFTNRDNQKEKKTTLSFSTKFTNGQGAENIEAYKISAQMEVQCGLQKFL